MPAGFVLDGRGRPGDGGANVAQLNTALGGAGRTRPVIPIDAVHRVLGAFAEFRCGVAALSLRNSA